jgi:flagellar protein FliO/FliZ
MIALLGFQSEAYAEQLNTSVKDCIENPENCKETTPAVEEGTGSNASTNGEVGITVWDVFKMILATIFVVALLYIILKFINKKNRSYQSTQLVENLGGTSLGTNRSVQIVKIGNRLLIVGVGENIQLLKEIDDSEEYHQIISDYNNRMEQLVQPSDIVTKVLQRTKKSSTSVTEGNHFQSLLKNQLDEIKKGRKKLYEEMEKKGSDK